MIVTQKINIKNGYILETKISNLKHIIMIYFSSHDKYEHFLLSNSSHWIPL